VPDWREDATCMRGSHASRSKRVTAPALDSMERWTFHTR
jgi:hypothetical protein